MGLMQAIQTGKKPMPPRILTYGTEGVGKTTLAANAPKSIFIQTEDGLGEIDCARFPLAKSSEDVFGALAELNAEKHEYRTVVIDSLDWLERLIWDAVCHEYRAASIEKADGGYQRGYVHALSHWRRLVEALNSLRTDKGMGIILIAHAKVERFEDPESTAYDRYSPRLHKHANALLTEWVDAVLFATRKIRTESEDTGFGRKRTTAVGVGHETGGERILRTVGGPACVAKNRYGLPPELPLSWPELYACLTNEITTKKGA
jgi:hypothetical protein